MDVVGDQGGKPDHINHSLPCDTERDECEHGTPRGYICNNCRIERTREHASRIRLPVNDNRSSLPEDDAGRLDFPMFDGLLAYFPNALAEVARVSKLGNDQHNPGQPMHWARGKSTDHENKIIRHLVDAGKLDARGVRHSARVAWRALALLQEEIERDEGAPMSRGSKAGETK